jgi:hypothetical protein
VWRAEASWVMTIGAHEVECAEWPRALRGASSRSSTLSIATVDDARPDAAMHRAVSEVGKAFIAASPATASRSRPGRLRVLVSDRWIALTTVPWGQALAGSTTRDRFLRDHLEAAGFEITAADTVRIDDDAAFGQPRIAVAYPAPLMDLLAVAAATLGAKLESVQPLEVVLTQWVCSRLALSAGNLAILDRDRLRFMRVAPGGLTAGQSLIEPALSADRRTFVRTLWQRQRLRDPALGERASLQALDLQSSTAEAASPTDSDVTFVEWPQDRETAPSPAMRAALVVASSSSLNGSTTARKRSAAGWLVGSTCLILAAALGGHAFRLSHAAGTLELAAERQARIPAVSAPLKWTRDELGRIRAVNAAIREINLPIAAVLRALQPPRDIRVALLSIAVEPASADHGSVDAKGATLKISAESASGAEMTRYVGYLAGRPPLERAYLVSHVVEAGSAYPYRFTAEVAWRE